MRAPQEITASTKISPPTSRQVAGLAPLRILLVAEAAAAGAGRHVVDLSLGLAELGHRVHLIYSPVRADNDLLAQVHKDNRITSHAVKINRAPGFSDLNALLAIRRYIRKHGPFDVVHGHSTKGALGCIAALGTPAVRVFTAHGLRSLDRRLSRASKFAYACIERTLARFAHRVIAVSQFEAQHAKSIGIRPDAIRTVINGINLETGGNRKAARQKLGLHDDDIAIGYVGRFSSEKGPDRLIEAFAEMAPDNPKARLILTGDGPLLQPLKALAVDKAIDDRIIWTGAVNGREIMAGFDIFALASAYEAMPYVLLEAAAAGLPMVVTDVGGARTIVSNGENGFITVNWNRSEFSGRLSELAANRAQRVRMGRKSRERSVEYGVGPMIENTLAVYADVKAERKIK